MRLINNKNYHLLYNTCTCTGPTKIFIWHFTRHRNSLNTAGEVCVAPGKCFAITYTEVQTVRTVSSDEIELLSLRSKLASTDICDFCSHHAQVFLHNYSALQRKCCNVFDQHKDSKPRRKSLREITRECRASTLKVGISLVPGNKLTYRNCLSKLSTSSPYLLIYQFNILFEQRAPFVCFH